MGGIRNEGALLHITGETRVYVVIGDPIAQVKSTHLYNTLSAETQADVVFIPMQFSAEDFERSVDGLRAFKNLAGIIPTIPHKPRMMEMVDRCSKRAQIVGAVNSIRVEPDGQWVGDMFDGIGYVNGLIRNGHEPVNKSFLLIGAGGAGAAISIALADAGVQRLRIIDLNLGKVDRIIANVRANYPNMEIDTGPLVPAEFDVVANATPLGMASGDPLPVAPDLLRRGQLVTDMIMKPAVTPLLVQAEGKGCVIQVGYDALVGQAAANLEFFGLAT
jgi:shikimate dehydrogenase